MSDAYTRIHKDPDDPDDLGRLEVGGIRVTRSRYAPLLDLPPHFHEYPCLTVVIQGAVAKTFGQSLYTITSPGAIAMPREEPHRALFSDTGAEVMMVEPTDDPSSMLGEATHLFAQIRPLRDPMLSALAWRLRREFADPDPVTPLAVTGLVLEMLARAARRNPTQHKRPVWIGRAEDYLHANFLEGFELASMAEAVGQPVGQLARQFRAHLGVSPSGYVRQLRVDWALRELATTDRPLSDIALEAGFSDQSHFTRVFKRHMGVTPAHYRKGARR